MPRPSGSSEQTVLGGFSESEQNARWPFLATPEMAAKRFQYPEKDADNFCGLAERPRGA